MQVHMYTTYKLQFRVTLVHEVAAVVRAMGTSIKRLSPNRSPVGVLRSGSHV